MPTKLVESVNSLQSEYVEECCAMIKYAIRGGKKLDCDSIQKFEEILSHSRSNNKASLRDLADLHSYLVEVVSPATPRTIMYTESFIEKNIAESKVFLIPLVKRLMFVAITCLVSLITISLSSEVNGDPKNFNLFASSGWTLLLNELFLVSSAGLGAAFSSLFKANKYIVQGTYDPSYETSYWLHLILGLVAGTILAMLIPIEQIEQLTHTDAGEINLSSLNGLGKPLLAIAGGFSASLVYKALIKMVHFLESVLDTLVPGSETSNSQRTITQTVQVAPPFNPQSSSNSQLTSEGRPSSALMKQSIIEPEEVIPVVKKTKTVPAPSHNSFMSALRSFIELGEGYRETVYLDSLGIPTIGIGCNLQDSRNKATISAIGINPDDLINGHDCLSREQIDQIFDHQVQLCFEEIKELVPSFDQLNDMRKIVLIDMIFNLGKNRLSKFAKFRKAIAESDFARAGEEMCSSRWYKQVGIRGKRNVHIMVHGTLYDAPHVTKDLRMACSSLESSDTQSVA